MKYIIIVFVCLTLFCIIGCEIDSNNYWRSAPAKYRCTEEEMERVESESSYCIDNTSYKSSFCYASAFMRNCTKIEE